MGTVCRAVFKSGKFCECVIDQVTTKGTVWVTFQGYQVCSARGVRGCEGGCTVGGGVMEVGISAIQILYEIFVRNLFDVFKDLCGCTLGIAFAT